MNEYELYGSETVYHQKVKIKANSLEQAKESYYGMLLEGSIRENHSLGADSSNFQIHVYKIKETLVPIDKNTETTTS